MAYLTPLLGVPWRVSDSNGDPAVSYAYFYEAGTTTPKAVYSDAGLSSAHPSPLTSDAAGVFPAIYASAGSFKIDVQDSEGASLPGFPLDNVSLDTFGAITATFFQVNPGTGAGGAVAVNADLAEDSEYQWKADNVVRWKATRQDSNPDRLTFDAFNSSGSFTGTTLDLRSDGRVLNRGSFDIGATPVLYSVAHARYDGITPSTPVSSGFSSIARNSTGNYTFTFSSSHNNYYPMVIVEGTSPTTIAISNPLAASFDVRLFDSAGSAVNRIIRVQVFKVPA